jgi:hypothetical protein
MALELDDDLFGNVAAAIDPASANIARVKDILSGRPAVPAFVRITEPGIFRVPEAQYHADPVEPYSISRGEISHSIEKTMAHAKSEHPRFAPEPDEDDEAEEPTRKFDVGTAAHALILEGENVVEVVDPKDHPGPKGGIPKGWTTDAMKVIRAEIESRGKIAMLPKQAKRVRKMAEAFHRQLAESELGIKDLHAQGESEMTVIWEENGMFFRVRPDWKSYKKIYRGKRLVLDLKTTDKSASPGAFKPAEYAKDIQEYMYRRGLKAVEKEDYAFLFAVIETKYPYLMSIISLDAMTKDMAKQKFELGKAMWEKSLFTGEWPGYPTGICEVESKPWEIASWETKSMTIGCEEE